MTSKRTQPFAFIGCPGGAALLDKVFLVNASESRRAIEQKLGNLVQEVADALKSSLRAFAEKQVVHPLPTQRAITLLN